MNATDIPDAQAVRHPLLGLMRRFAVDWLDRADPGTCREIMAPGYTVSIGGEVLTGLASYVPATLGQLDRFPGLLLTVHDLFLAGDRIAMRFTEHGPSAADGGRAAAWPGIGLFWWDGSVLVRNVTEEDYFGRRRQLADGVCDPIEAPMAAPWAVPDRGTSPEAESAVREWLERGDFDGALLDDGWTGRSVPPLLEVAATDVKELFSAGDRVAFHVVQSGRYIGGLPDTNAAIGRNAELSAAGMVTVTGGRAVAGRVVRDRLGLRRRLR